MSDRRQEKRADSWKEEARRLSDLVEQLETQQWNHVNHCLPDPSQWVVIYRGNIEDELNSTQIPFDVKQGWFVCDQYLRETHRITHWFEIPEPPHLEIFGE